ncbi:OmpA family protein [Roseivirga sp. BDSF3-8]|uniref:OmpA family protein n=1 Tax=Roseivirga sp. BDSF3-8 TaxID=3241598 RepID=UPI003531B953
MKRYTKHLRRVSYLFPAIVLLLLGTQATATSQSGGKGAYTPVPGKTDYKEVNYVVIGVFEFSDNAGRFMSAVENQGFKPDYFFFPPKQYYYVYVSQEQDFEKARQEVLQLREKNGFEETWVFNPHMIGYMGDNQPDPADDQWTEEARSEKNEPEEKREEPEETAMTDDSAANKDLPASLGNMSAANLDSENHLVVEEDVEGIYKIYTDVNRLNDQVDISTEVELIDNVRAKAIGTLPAHEVKVVKDPENGARSLQLVAQPFGYRRMIHTLNLDEPVSDDNEEFVQVDGGVIYVNFPLERLKKDDKVIMYKVFFQNDAAILRPESKYEVNALLEMMKENEDYEIKLHGHTNGNSAGKIIRLGEGSRDYFTMDNSVEEGWGSAKQLSKERAETIKRFLVDNGVDESRIQVKGWGGKQMIFDKNSSSAKKNIRVEVEVLKD